MQLRLPWLPFPLIEQLATRAGPGTQVFEYGGGGSTLWFLDRGATVVTVEHHPEWASQLRRAITHDEWTLLERSLDDSGRSYVDAITGYEDGAFDVVVVDGRQRVCCAHAALAKIRPGGWLIFDDIDRARYQPGLQAIGWPRQDYIAFAPAKPTLSYTAVFTRPA